LNKYGRGAFIAQIDKCTLFSPITFDVLFLFLTLDATSKK